jgi:hypothetical protein
MEVWDIVFLDVRYKRDWVFEGEVRGPDTSYTSQGLVQGEPKGSCRSENGEKR